MTLGRWILLAAWIDCLLSLVISHRGPMTTTLMGLRGPVERDWAGRDRANYTTIEFQHGWPIPLAMRTEHAKGWDVTSVDWRLHRPGLVLYVPWLSLLAVATFFSCRGARQRISLAVDSNLPESMR